MTREHRKYWSLDPDVIYLNHGSFGACPTAVIEYQQSIQRRLERQPMTFFLDDYEGLLDVARQRLATFVGANSENLTFVPNATTGVNTVLRSLEFQPGDELLTTDQEYNASRQALEYVAKRAGARVVVVTLPFPLDDPVEITQAIVGEVTSRTRLALIDHISSPTGLVLPIEAIVSALNERGVDTLVDGAHGPGMVPLSLETMGAAYYTGNCHKWMSTPKGSALLHVRADKKAGVRPLQISHGYTKPRADRSLFFQEFDWTGTFDPSAWLAVPYAIDHIGALHPDGWPGVMRHNRDLALWARETIATHFGTEACYPDSMVGALAAVRLPDCLPPGGLQPGCLHPTAVRVLDEFGIQTIVAAFPAPPVQLLRISAQLYNGREDFQQLLEALIEVV